MIIFEQVFRDLLISSNLVDTRCFLVRAPQVPAEQQRNPYIVFFHLGPSPYHAHSGPLALFDRDFQVSIFDVSQTRALYIADSMRSYLDGFTGEYEGVLFGGLFYRNQVIQHEQATKLFHVVQEYRIQYRLTDHVQPVTPDQLTRKTRTGVYNP